MRTTTFKELKAAYNAVPEIQGDTAIIRLAKALKIMYDKKSFTRLKLYRFGEILDTKSKRQACRAAQNRWPETFDFQNNQVVAFEKSGRYHETQYTCIKEDRRKTKTRGWKVQGRVNDMLIRGDAVLYVGGLDLIDDTTAHPSTKAEQKALDASLRCIKDALEMYVLTPSEVMVDYACSAPGEPVVDKPTAIPARTCWETVDQFEVLREKIFGQGKKEIIVDANIYREALALCEKRGLTVPQVVQGYLTTMIMEESNENEHTNNRTNSNQ